MMPVTRRTFIKGLVVVGAAAAAAGAGLSRLGWPLPPSPAGPHLLSTKGSSRATGYLNANKIVTVADKTHVGWLDAEPEGFRVKVATLDVRTSSWSPPVTVGPAVDNHGGPALAVDSAGYLHVAYGPHNKEPMSYRRSRRPNDASEWEEEVQFGQRVTYPTLLVGQDDTLYLTCRGFSRTSDNYVTELWTKPRGQPWSGPVPLLASRHPDYASFVESLAWGPDGRSLHLACTFHEKSDSVAYGRLQTIGYMVSRDAGRSWERSDGTPIRLPATVPDIEVVAEGGLDAGSVLQAGPIAVDRTGSPLICYAIQQKGRGHGYLARRKREGGWERVLLNESLPARLADWQICEADGVVLDGEGNLVIVVTLQRVRPDEIDPRTLGAWGHPTNEVGRFTARAFGGPLEFEWVSQPDATVPQWLPNLERPTGHNAVRLPRIIYTSGGPGARNDELTTGKVFFV